MLTATRKSRKVAEVTGVPAVHRWTYTEYQKLAQTSFFFKRRVELLGGRIIEMAPQGDLHTAAIELGRAAVAKSFGEGFWVRIHAPLHLSRWSAPEPDLAVIPGTVRDTIGKGHPKSALLVIEVSDSTLWYDRRRKGPRYAKAGYPDYWIINLVDRCVEVYRKPMQDPSAALGWRYAEVSIMVPPASITPLSTSIPIPVSELLPLQPVPKTATS